MIRLCVLTTFWHRPEVTAIYWAGLTRASRHLYSRGVELCLSAAISPGDEANLAIITSEPSAFPRHILEIDNRPLAAKHNATSLGADSLWPDYCVLVDSDDLLSNSMWSQVAGMMASGHDYAGLIDFHVYDLSTKRLGRWVGFPHGNPRHGEPIGVGRVWSRRVLNAVDWKLWPDSDRLTGMDGLSHQRVTAAGFQCVANDCATWGGYALDLKSETNMWPYDRLPLVEADRAILQHFPELP